MLNVTISCLKCKKQNEIDFFLNRSPFSCWKIKCLIIRHFKGARGFWLGKYETVFAAENLNLHVEE